MAGIAPRQECVDSAFERKAHVFGEVGVEASNRYPKP